MIEGLCFQCSLDVSSSSRLVVMVCCMIWNLLYHSDSGWWVLAPFLWLLVCLGFMVIVLGWFVVGDIFFSGLFLSSDPSALPFLNKQKKTPWRSLLTQ